MALVCDFIMAEDQLNVEPAIERAMIKDVDQIQAEIPPDHLAVQWDVCYEVVGSPMVAPNFPMTIVFPVQLNG